VPLPRGQGVRDGLNPNVWFGNVQLVVAKNFGQQTVRYGSDIYEYYISYKRALEPSHEIETLEAPNNH
jgi:hypothetical protein